MSESVVINCVEKIGKTMPTCLGGAENKNARNNICMDDAGSQSSHDETESLSITKKFVSCSKQMSPLPNGSEESPGPMQMSPLPDGSEELPGPKKESPLPNGSETSLNEARQDASVEFNEMNPTQFPAEEAKSVPSNIGELHSDSEIDHLTERGDFLNRSSCDAVSSNQASVSDCDLSRIEDVEELPIPPKSNTLKADEEFCSDLVSKQTSPMCCVDTVKNHSDMESLNGEDGFPKNSSETVSIDCTSLIVDADQKNVMDSDMIESSETVDVGSNIHEKDNGSAPDLIKQNRNTTSSEDSATIEKCDQPYSFTEAVDEVKPVEMTPTSKLDSEVNNPTEISLKAQSLQAVDETPISSFKSSREFEMESKAVTVSVGPTSEIEKSNSCQDSLPQKSEPDMKRVDETASCCSDMEDEIDQIKAGVDEKAEGSDKKQVMSPFHINLDGSNDRKATDEEDEKERMDLLEISKVETCNDEGEGMNESKKGGNLTDSHVKSEAKKEAPDNPVEKIDSKENCKIVTKEMKNSDDDRLRATEATDVIEEMKKVGQSGDGESSVVKNDAIVVEPESAMKISFKNILKKRESLEAPKDIKQCETAASDFEETIVIDEMETLPSTLGESAKAKDVLKSEKPQPEVTNAKKEDILSNEPESAKKRSFESSVETSKTFSPKRQRLDHVINKVGDHVGIKPAEATTVIMDSDDDCAPSPQASDKAAKDENKMETNGRIVKLSGQMLRNLIKASMRSFVRNQVLEKEQVINERMKKMEAAIDLWRETAKHLEKSMNELTSFTKEFTKCKSQSLKLKHLASRTVAVQVSINQNQNQPKTTNISNQNRSTSLSLPPSVLRHSVPTQPGPSSNRPMAQTNGNVRPNQPMTPRQVRPGGPRGGPVIPGGSQQPNRVKIPNSNQASIMAQPQSSSSQQSHVMRPLANYQMVPQSGRVTATRPPNLRSFQGSSSNMIDLTAEDDTSKQTKAAPPAPQRAMKGSLPTSAGQNSAHSSNLGRGSQPETNVINSSNNQTVRSGGSALGDRLNASTKPLTGGSVQHTNNMRNVNGTSMVASTSKSGAPANSSGVTNGQAASRTPPSESSSKAPGTSGPGTSASPRSLPPSVYVAQPTKHPAPLPVETYTVETVNTTKLPPPKPSLKISRVAQGIVLSWNMPVIPSNVADIASYQLFAYQETSSAPSPSLWKKVGDVKALPLPMACTLVQFQEGNKYFFAVRAIDHFGRWGEYSDPSSIYLFPK